MVGNECDTDYDNSKTIPTLSRALLRLRYAFSCERVGEVGNPDAAKQHDRIWCDPRLRMGSREGMGCSCLLDRWMTFSSIIDMAEIISMHTSSALSAFYELLVRRDWEFLRKK
jgi:hypothetical protein